MRAYRKPFPDDEDHWVQVPAELVCLAVAWGDPKFAAENQANIDAEIAASQPQPRKKK